MTESSKEAGASISPKSNGPLIVKLLKVLANSKGESLETRETIALCRCGKSGKKPFCDGAHVKAGFSSENQADSSLDRRDDYPGQEIVLHDNRLLCAHVGVCTDSLAEVFLLGQEPWIDPDGASADAITEVVRKCPSGALSYSIQGNWHGEFDREPAITVSQNGPYYVVGGIDLEMEQRDGGASKEHYALCRCGASKNKPFCDGAHWKIEFVDEAN